MFRHAIPILFFLSCALTALGQSGNNPFELTPRLSPAERQHADSTDATSVAVPDNPFELVAPTEEATAPDAIVEQEREEEESGTEPGGSDANSGWLLAVAVGLIFLWAIVLIFFRSLYVKVYRAVINDNLLGQLYREREAGAVGRFLVGYLLFFLGGGFFLYLVFDYFETLPVAGVIQNFGILTLVLLVLFLAKHLLLAVLGYVFPVGKEIRRYSFTIMVFSILLGFILAPATFLYTFGPVSWQYGLLIAVGGLIILAYLLRSLRGLFIANRFLFSYLFHFLLYICAVEIIPALLLYKLIVDSFA